MEENELITLEQLPIIKYHLEQLSKEIKEKVDRANSLVVNEDTVKDVKQVRADLNKEFNELETQRKQVKQAIMSKYDEFEEIYKENVSNLYKDADAQLKEKIDEVENSLKVEKELELREFYNEYYKANDILIALPFERVGLNITLSSSMKSLKEQIKTFLEKVANDLKLISQEEYKDDMLFEYQNHLDYATAKAKVLERHRMLDLLNEMQKKDDEKQQQEEKIAEQVDEIIAPVEVVEEETMTVTFTITDTKENILKVREFMKKEGIKYE